MICDDNGLSGSLAEIVTLLHIGSLRINDMPFKSKSTVTRRMTDISKSYLIVIHSLEVRA